jgi:pyrophosphatase PpaX
MGTVHTILFDLDGTLIDSVDLILRSYRHTLWSHRGAVVPDEIWLEGLGTPLRNQLRAVTDDPEEIERMVVTYRDFNFAHHDEMVRPFPGIIETISELKELGVVLGVVTSKARSGLKRGLNVSGLDRMFDVLVSMDDVERHKPDPEPVLKALEILGASADHTVFVGDSPHDMAAGRSAGVQTAAALWGPFPRATLEPHCPGYWLTAPTDIVALTAP